MRINKFVAASTGLSRRRADQLIANKDITINNEPVEAGYNVRPGDTVRLDSKVLIPRKEKVTILLHKPVGYVCSRKGQGSKTIYDLLPKELHHLKPVGRLDKDSSGLLLLTSDGELAHQLTHPSFKKEKIYEIELDKELTPANFEKITKQGVELEDGQSTFALDYINNQNFAWKVTMSEGRNRQIRRTFAALGYTVAKLHRTQFGSYTLDSVQPGQYQNLHEGL